MTGTASPEPEHVFSPLPNGHNGALTPPTRLEDEDIGPETTEDVVFDQIPDEPTTNGHVEVVEVEAAVEEEREQEAVEPKEEEAAEDEPKPEPQDDDRGQDENKEPSEAAAPSSPSSDRPSKRRRLRDTTPPPSSHDGSSALRKKPESPPWKKAAANGPSSFTENGMRKSGRINAVPLEQLTSADKRITRRALHTLQGSTTPAAKTRGGKATASTTVNGKPNAAADSPHALTPQSASGRASRSSTRHAAPPPPPPSKQASARQPPRKSLPAAHEATRPSPRTRRRSMSPPPVPSHRSAGTRRSSRYHRDSFDAGTTTPTKDGSSSLQETPPSRTRIRLRLRPATIPVVHPDEVRRRPRLAESLEEYILTVGPSLPVEAGGLATAEDFVAYGDDDAARDARTVARVERELRPGGLLTAERCSAFAPEPAEEPPRLWAHADHVAKAAANFRRLMLAEQARHRAAAKRVADACRDEWIRRQPKSADQLEAEAREAWRARFRIVGRALAATWDNARAEINRRKLEAWEAEESRRVKAALNEAVTASELKLQARRAAQVDSDMPTEDDAGEDVEYGEEDEDDEDEDGSGEGSDREGGEDDDDDDEDNMSSSDDDSDDEKADQSDEELTQEQLRLKYASLPELETAAADEGSDDEAGATPLEATDRAQSDAGAEGDAAADSTSDESVDMDDDLGSTDMDDDDDGMGSDGSEGDDEESDEEPSGLLGLFFGKSELKKMKTEAAVEEEEEEVKEGEDTEMGEPDTDGGAHEPEKADASSPKLNGVAPPVLNGGDAMDVDDEYTLVGRPGSGSVSAEDKAVAKQRSPAANGVGMLAGAGGQDAEESQSDLLETKELIVPVVNGIEKEEEPSAEVEPIPATTKAEVAEDELPVKDTEMATAEVEPLSKAASPSPSQSLQAPEPKPAEKETPAATPTEEVASRQASAPPANAPKTEIPFLLRGTLREYQHYGLDWLAGLYANNTNGILADEMGLGKTIQTIALLAHLACKHEVWGPHLVIVPTSVMLNWEMEFKKWCPGFKILAYYGTQEERKRKRIGWNNDDVWNVCVTSYQLVLQDQQVFKRRRWHYMILDEAHNIKNFKSQRWQTLLTFNTHSRLLLTGTPLQNNLTELWSLLFFLMPSESSDGAAGFADLQEFHDWFRKPEAQILESGREEMDDEARAIIAKLHKMLRPYLLRRLKADVEKQMPAKYEHVEICRLSKRQRELYDGFLARNDTRHTLSSGNYLSIINCLMQLRKVCNHPDLFVDRPIMTSFRMQKSVTADFGPEAAFVRGHMFPDNPLSTVRTAFLNLVPAEYETMSSTLAETFYSLGAQPQLNSLKESQFTRASSFLAHFDPETVKSNLAYVESGARWRRYEELRHSYYANALRRQQRPIYGKSLVDFLTVGVDSRPQKPRPRVPQKMMAWFEEDSTFLRAMVPTVNQRAASFDTIIEKFACVTPAVVTRDMTQLLLGDGAARAFTETDLRLSAPVKHLPFMPREPPTDPWHVARMRLSIQFPDKRLLQYDCGKLQALDRLLRRLQSGGHRALIFTQMTKVLDILEQFLNIHGHKYLRLDGATKVEQRQILTERFNHDTRILCFILSTRSGGLGINLTGADTVVFYDQDWNPAMDKQCQDRCHRIGQTRDVHIYRLVSEHTIEANILRKAMQKQMLDDVVIQDGDFTTDRFARVAAADAARDDGHRGGGGDTERERDEDADHRRDAAAANAAMDRVLGVSAAEETTTSTSAAAAAATAGDGKSGDKPTTDAAAAASTSQAAAIPDTAAAAVAAPRPLVRGGVSVRVLEQAEDTEDVAAARAAEREIQADDADFVERGPGFGAGAASASGVSSARQGTPLAGGGGARPGQGVFAADGTLLGEGAVAAAGEGEDADVDVDDEEELNAWGGKVHNIDHYLLKVAGEQLAGIPLDLPKDKKKGVGAGKKKKDGRKRIR